MRNGVKLTLGAGVCVGLVVAVASCKRPDSSDKRVFVLGLDGMDPQVLQPLMDCGQMPNFTRLAKMGGFKPLGTSTPPQSPVAWSNVITGCDASVHGIFDFIHRDPKTMMPYLSTSKAGDPGKSFRWRQWNIPLSGGEGIRLLRRGTPFWEYITEAGYPATVFRMPSQYPPGESKGAKFTCLTGMGTPDLQGTYGIFSSFSSDPAAQEESVSGGHMYRLRMKGPDRAEGRLIGPPNHMLAVEEKKSPPDLEIPFTVDRDPTHPVVRISIQDRHIVLKVGEWSDWLRITFETGFPGQSVVPGATVRGLCRMYLRAVRPYIELYVTPLEIDPLEPFQPISEPPEFATELAEETGLFYTQGIPEDHAALSEGALDDDQYLTQAEIVLQERLRHLDYMLKRFQGGFFFFYFGSTDQVAHMFWRDVDPMHPTYTKELAAKYGQVINRVYLRMDEALGRVMEQIGRDDLLIVMSDHGFNSFARGFNLNTWLKDNGYISLMGNFPQDKYEMFIDVDWSATKAYNLGINCLYVNLRGREKDGIVEPGHERDELLKELIAKLKEVKDPQTGRNVIAEVYRTDEMFPGADPDIAPDLLVGYDRGYRASWGTILGKMPYEWIVDNTDRWSGDHCVATHLVPGVLLANRPIRVDDPTLLDLAPSILAAFGIPQPEQMKGRNLF